MKVITYDLEGNIVKVEYKTKKNSLFDDASMYTDSFDDALSLEASLEAAEEEAERDEKGEGKSDGRT